MFINLKLFAEHSQKIPKSFLAPTPKKKHDIPLYKVFLALMIDLAFIASFVAYMSTMLIITVNAQFLPAKLSLSSLSTILEFSAFPLMGLSYFFAANLLNNGQSIGMSYLKIRVPTHSKGYYESFTWAARSMLGALSFGISLIMTKSVWKEVKSHDFLYSELLAHKEHAPINLLDEIEHFTHEAEVTQEDFQIAA